MSKWWNLFPLIFSGKKSRWAIPTEELLCCSTLWPNPAVARAAELLLWPNPAVAKAWPTGVLPLKRHLLQLDGGLQSPQTWRLAARFPSRQVAFASPILVGRPRLVTVLGDIFTNLDFPEIRGFPLLFTTIWMEVV